MIFKNKDLLELFEIIKKSNFKKDINKLNIDEKGLQDLNYLYLCSPLINGNDFFSDNIYKNYYGFLDKYSINNVVDFKNKLDHELIEFDIFENNNNGLNLAKGLLSRFWSFNSPLKQYFNINNNNSELLYSLYETVSQNYKQKLNSPDVSNYTIQEKFKRYIDYIVFMGELLKKNFSSIKTNNEKSVVMESINVLSNQTQKALHNTTLTLIDLAIKNDINKDETVKSFARFIVNNPSINEKSIPLFNKLKEIITKDELKKYFTIQELRKYEETSDNGYVETEIKGLNFRLDLVKLKSLYGISPIILKSNFRLLIGYLPKLLNDLDDYISVSGIVEKEVSITVNKVEIENPVVIELTKKYIDIVLSEVGTLDLDSLKKEKEVFLLSKKLDKKLEYKETTHIKKKKI